MSVSLGIFLLSVTLTQSVELLAQEEAVKGTLVVAVMKLRPIV